MIVRNSLNRVVSTCLFLFPCPYKLLLLTEQVIVRRKKCNQYIIERMFTNVSLL